MYLISCLSLSVPQGNNYPLYNNMFERGTIHFMPYCESPNGCRLLLWTGKGVMTSKSCMANTGQNGNESVSCMPAPECSSYHDASQSLNMGVKIIEGCQITEIESKSLLAKYPWPECGSCKVAFNGNVSLHDGIMVDIPLNNMDTHQWQGEIHGAPTHTCISMCLYEAFL